MKVNCQVITTPTVDTPGTVVTLNCQEKRYMFGQISEGTQRVCVERGIKLMALSDVFITGRTGWANNGGLIGLVLTMADSVASNVNSRMELREEKMKKLAGLPPDVQQKLHRDYPPILPTTLRLHGAPNLTHTVATARRFVFRRGVPLRVTEYNSESIRQGSNFEASDPFEAPTFSDANIKVWALPLNPDSSNRSSVTSQTSSPRKRVLDEFQEIDHPERALNEHDASQALRQSVISDMFDSNWKMDALVETPLAEVSMPAALFVRNPETKDLEPYKGPKPSEGQPLPDIKVFVRKPWPGATVDTLPSTKPSKESICYIARGHDSRGKFDPQKAKELRVPYGRAFGELTAGKSVQSEDGKTITPDMVLGPSRKANGFAIMEIPSVDYIEPLFSLPQWQSPAVMTGLKAFVWILGPGVGNHPRLREFIGSMPDYEHTVSSTDYCPNYLALTSVAGSVARMAQLNGDIYSVPIYDNSNVPQSQALLSSPNDHPLAIDEPPFEPLQPGYVFELEPQFKFDKANPMSLLDLSTTKIDIPKSVQQRMSVIQTRLLKPKFQAQLKKIRKNLPGADAEIITLGTGSSVPSKYRNVSATLINVPGVGYYLLDCGEDTLGQLQRVYDAEELREVLRNLRMIWISHLHADHHLGTVSVIKAWYQVNYGADAKRTADSETDLPKILQEKRLSVVSDEMMIVWLEEYAQVEDYGFHKVLPLCAYPNPSGPSITTKFAYRHNHNGGPPFGSNTASKTILDFQDDSSPFTPLLKSSTGLCDILTTGVKHCRAALAVSLVFPNGFKVSYSGDCRPSDKFASIGRNSTVLIHEATFQNDMVGSALAKRHSTAAEAIEVGRRMGARSIVLTHFSQRYQKVAQLDRDEGAPVGDQQSFNREAAKDAAAVAERLPADADIPIDDPEDEPIGATASAALLLDDIHMPTARRPGLPRSSLYVPGVNLPILAAMDYMRVKVGDIAIAQSYAPALEKIVDVLERESLQKAAEIKERLDKEEEARRVETTKKHDKKNEKNKKKAAAAAAGAAVATVVSEEAKLEESTPEEPARPKISAFDASESEDGWETSDYEP